MKATTVTKLFIVCPYCESQETSVGHLEIGRSFGPWFCQSCGKAYRGTRTEDGAEIELVDKTMKDVAILVQYIHDPRLQFVVKGLEFSEFKEPDHEHFYNEHACPSNIMNAVRHVKFESDPDPHGVFEFVRVLGDFSEWDGQSKITEWCDEELEND